MDLNLFSPVLVGVILVGSHSDGGHPPHAENLRGGVRGVIEHSSRDAEIGKHRDIILGFQTTLWAP